MAAQATLQSGWSILLPTAEERARALSSLLATGSKCVPLRENYAFSKPGISDYLPAAHKFMHSAKRVPFFHCVNLLVQRCEG